MKLFFLKIIEIIYVIFFLYILHNKYYTVNKITQLISMKIFLQIFTKLTFTSEKLIINIF